MFALSASLRYLRPGVYGFKSCDHGVIACFLAAGALAIARPSGARVSR